MQMETLVIVQLGGVKQTYAGGQCLPWGTEEGQDAGGGGRTCRNSASGLLVSVVPKPMTGTGIPEAGWIMLIGACPSQDLISLGGQASACPSH